MTFTFILSGCSQTAGEQVGPMAYGYEVVKLPGEEEGKGTNYEFELSDISVKDKNVQINIRRWGEDTSGDAVTYYGIIVELPKTENVSTLNYSFIKERPSATRSGRNDKLKVTGVGDVLDWTGLNLSFKIDLYKPWVHVEFPSGITEEQVELLHDLVKENKQIRMIILSPQEDK